MEIITSAIIGALGKLSEKAVNDAYLSLKSLLNEKFGVDSEISVAVEALEKDSDSNARKEVLNEQAKKLNLTQDEQIDYAVLRLNQCTEGKTNVNVTISDNATAQGIIGAEEVNVGEMNFGTPKKG